jgi:hypothetical protein
MTDAINIDHDDLKILRALARRRVELSRHPVNQERREAWYKLDCGAPDARPMVLIEHGGIADKVKVLPDSMLQCKGQEARGFEWAFRHELYQFEVLKDDHVIEPYWNIGWAVGTSNYGVETVQHYVKDYEGMGARTWDAPIKNLDGDLGKLRPRTFSVDREATFKSKAYHEAIFEDALPIRIRGGYWWTLGMTWSAIDLIGLENLMLYMFDNPEGLHRLMAFLRDDHIAYARWLEKEQLLCLNNENDYIGSGSMGYSRELPQPDWKPGMPVRLKDLWVLSESQETVGVGPDQFEEFIFPYQLAVAELFGKCYYGCCEPVNNRWHVLKRFPNLARVSVSPWADEAFMARECGRKVVYSRKPNPTLISTTRFDEDAIRADLRKTLSAAGGCRLEIVMKDVHTINNEPERLPRWVALAREVIAGRT